MIKLYIKVDLLNQTINLLKEFTDKERIVLWIGNRTDQGYVVNEIYLPLQHTREDYFNIPEEGMELIMSKLKTSRQMLVAQIHTHPFEAFHSRADDNWAILRHVNAYSLVLPYFCSTTNESNFKVDVASFVLNESNNWIEIDNSNLIIL